MKENLKYSNDSIDIDEQNIKIIENQCVRAISNISKLVDSINKINKRVVEDGREDRKTN